MTRENKECSKSYCGYKCCSYASDGHILIPPTEVKSDSKKNKRPWQRRARI